MNTLFIPTENDFKRWIKEAIYEYLNEQNNSQPKRDEEEGLLNRKEIAGILRISLVTLHDYMKRGLPRHKKRGRVLFDKEEVLDWYKSTGKRNAEEVLANSSK